MTSLLTALALGLMSFTTMETDTIQKNLADTVAFLAGEIGQRSFHDLGKLNRSADYIEARFRSFGCEVTRQAFTYHGNTYYNIVAEVKGSEAGKDGILVIGAHYDTVTGTPGADDNASGIAGILELARLTMSRPLKRTVHFVAFTLEEPPVFMTEKMGSYVYAQRLREGGANVLGMISLEMLGYYCGQKGCQFYPLSLLRWFYPERGDFIAFVGNLSSRSFTNSVKDAFRSVSSVPIESLNAVSLIPGVSYSDHSSFWKFGFPAFMITDTAFLRNPYYHAPGDTPDTLDYAKMAVLVAGLYQALGKI